MSVSQGARKIAIFIHQLDGGGAQRDAILLANALACAGCRIAILTLGAEGQLKCLVAPDVEVIALAAQRLRACVPALRSALSRLEPHVFLSSESAPNIVALAATRLLPAASRPLLVLREVASPSVARREDPHAQSRAAYRFIGPVYRRADLVLTLTAGARDDLIRNFGVPAERITALGCNAVLAPETMQRLAASELSGMARERGLVVAVGRLSPEKDHLTLIEAMRLLPATCPARLVIVGEGERRARLEARTAELQLGDRVLFAGHRSDPFALLCKAELFVSASRFEGFGNAIVEALACGTPVVATDCPFGPREILENGRFGRLVPVGDPPALAREIAAVLAKPDVGRDALRARAAEFTADKAAAAVIAAIDAVQLRR